MNESQLSFYNKLIWVIRDTDLSCEHPDIGWTFTKKAAMDLKREMKKKDIECEIWQQRVGRLLDAFSGDAQDAIVYGYED